MKTTYSVVTHTQELSIFIFFDQFKARIFAMGVQNSLDEKIHLLENQTYLFYIYVFPGPRPSLLE